LAALRSFHEYLGTRAPELLEVAQQVKAIPFKRAAPKPTHFLEVEEARGLVHGLPARGPRALRDRTLLLFLWNTGARVQEAADLRWTQLDLGPRSRVELHGKGDKWRACPLWPETARELSSLRDRSA